MFVKVSYFNKSDKDFFNILKTESDYETVFGYRVAEKIVYVMNSEKDKKISLPKLIKKLYENDDFTHFLAIESTLTKIKVYMRKGDDFEFYSYDNEPAALIQLFASLNEDPEVKYKIFYIENEELEYLIKEVKEAVSDHIRFSEDDIIPVEVSITKEDLEEIFKETNIEEKIKDFIKTVKSKINFDQLKSKLNIDDKKLKLLKLISIGIVSTSVIGIISYFYYLDYTKKEKARIAEEKANNIIKTQKNPIERLEKNYILYSMIKKIFSENICNYFEFINNKITFNIDKPKYKNYEGFLIPNSNYFSYEDILLPKETLKASETKSLKTIVDEMIFNSKKYRKKFQIGYIAKEDLVYQREIIINKDDLLNFVYGEILNNNGLYDILIYKINKDDYIVSITSKNGLAINRQLGENIIKSTSKLKNLDSSEDNTVMLDKGGFE